MRNVVAVYLLIAGLTTTCTFGQKMDTRNVSDFTGIEASGKFDITVVKGDTESLTIEADDDVLPYVRSKVKEGELCLYVKKGIFRKIANSKSIKATIVMKNMKEVSLSDACKLTSNDLFTPKKFKGECSGTSSMSINVNAEKVSIECSDASLVDLKGSAVKIEIEMSGSSILRAEDFTARTADIETSGTSSVTINVTDVLKVEASKASQVYYKGSPVVKIESSGESKVKQIQ